MSEILAHVIRGNTLESLHRGHFVVIDGEGRRFASAGEPSTVTYFRSACKPHQTIPLITSGAADAFGFTEDEIAMASASHSGEPMHVEVVGRMLEKIGMTESDLRCGTHYPFSEAESRRMQRSGETPSQLHNNCSGKHVGMLALAKHIGADTETYEEIGHRVQQRILRAISEFTELPQEEIAIGIDGCAAPNFAVPIDAMARSFINLVAPDKLHPAIRSAASRVVSAMTHHPELIGGTERFDTILMRVAEGRLISKVGADGVWLCGVLPCERFPAGLSIALKIEDGDDLYSRSTVAVDLLKQLGVLATSDLSHLSPMPIKNRRDDKVGEIVSVLKL
jgi:L-asparaginase II